MFSVTSKRNFDFCAFILTVMTVCCSGGHTLRRLQHADCVWAETEIRYSSFVGICHSEVVWELVLISVIMSTITQKRLWTAFNEHFKKCLRPERDNYVLWWPEAIFMFFSDVNTNLIYSGWSHFSGSGTVNNPFITVKSESRHSTTDGCTQ